ncbi:thymidylate synthase, partial [bacterium]|nr:thymidylate synthase [bacterium]
THLYSNHIEQAKEQIGREPFELPKLKIKEGFDITSELDDMYEIDSFELWNYQCHPTIKAPLSN